MSTGHWSQMARLWQLVGPPLRPAPEDIAVFQDVVTRWIATHDRAPRALILGVTPELYALRWPSGTALQALDASTAMIEAVWPGPSADALVGSWIAMPLAAASCDIVLCDGGFGMLPYPHGQMALLGELHRVLAPDGVFAVRLFAPGGRTGTVDEVLADLISGRIASLDVLKLRLWGALHGDPRLGIRPREVVAHIRAAAGSYDRLAEEFGWPLEHVRALDLHRDSKAVYHLTEATEVVRMATSDHGGFLATTIVEPDSALGACCPIVTLQRLPSD